MKIEFRGKEIGELEAKTLISNLEKGVIKANLNKDEIILYNELISAGENSIFNVPKSEEEFLINRLQMQINVGKLIEKFDYCKKNGHSEKKGSSYFASGPSGTRVYATCSNCKMQYERKLTSEEWESFDKLMNVRFS